MTNQDKPPTKALFNSSHDFLIHETCVLGDITKLEELESFIRGGKIDVNSRDEEWGDRAAMHWAAHRGKRSLNTENSWTQWLFRSSKTLNVLKCKGCHRSKRLRGWFYSVWLNAWNMYWILPFFHSNWNLCRLVVFSCCCTVKLSESRYMPDQLLNCRISAAKLRESEECSNTDKNIWRVTPKSDRMQSETGCAGKSYTPFVSEVLRSLVVFFSHDFVTESLRCR